jgi:hypothetical protein
MEEHKDMVAELYTADLRIRRRLVVHVRLQMLNPGNEPSVSTKETEWTSELIRS